MTLSRREASYLPLSQELGLEYEARGLYLIAAIAEHTSKQDSYQSASLE